MTSVSVSVSDEDRSLVTVETIASLQSIDGADLIELAQVRGWNVVVKKGEFKPGDNCLYFEIDALLPLSDQRFAFLAPRGEKLVDGTRYHRLKTARLRGVYSQGLALPAEDFKVEIESCADAIYAARDMTVSSYLCETLGVRKYTEELPDSAVGPFRPGTPKTSSERVQNLVHHWHLVLADGPWVATEKIDGISCLVFRDPDGALRVYGRNWEVADGDNPYWNAVRKYRLADLLHPDSGVQFEIFGTGTGRKDRLGVGELRIAVFAYLVGSKVMPIHQAGSTGWPLGLTRHAVPVLDWQLPDTPEAAVAQVEKMRSVINPAKQAEGVVWHQRYGRALPELSYRTTLKAINNSYLLKNED